VEPILWNSSLETGHPEIDRQHRALLRAYNDLLKAMIDGRGRDEIQKTLVFLKDYTVEHFTMEERLMEMCDYAEAPDHKALHQEFVGKVTQFLGRFDRGAIVTISVMEFMRIWLLGHIQGIDKQLAESVKMQKRRA